MKWNEICRQSQVFVSNLIMGSYVHSPYELRNALIKSIIYYCITSSIPAFIPLSTYLSMGQRGTANPFPAAADVLVGQFLIQCFGQYEFRLRIEVENFSIFVWANALGLAKQVFVISPGCVSKYDKSDVQVIGEEDVWFERRSGVRRFCI